MTPENLMRIQKYRNIMTLGRKGEAVLVEHEETGERFVKKTLLLYDADVYRSLMEEKFPQIPPVQELIEDDGKLIVIEKYIEGKSLEEILEERLFDEQEAAELIVQLCGILKPLHSHDPKIIHRDIKPSNLILDEEGKLWLIDFDASRNLQPDQSQDTVLMGTQEYAAPEQYGFTQSTERTDIYAIGVVLNRLLTGDFPRRKMAEGNLAQVVRKCIHMDPVKRYRDVTALASAVKNRRPDYRPPGFRGKSIPLKIAAGAGYIFLLATVISLQVTRTDGLAPGTAEIAANRAAVGIILFGWVFYLGNYLGFREVFPWGRQGRPVFEILRIFVGVFVIFAVPVMALVLMYPAE